MKRLPSNFKEIYDSFAPASSLALLRAGIPQSSWNIVDATAEEGAAISQRLLENGLPPEGADEIRITGLGQNASSLQ